MPCSTRANIFVSVTELKRNFAKVLKQTGKSPVAILHRDRPKAYLLSADYYEQLISRLEDLEDARLVHERADGPFLQVVPNEL